MIKRLPSVFAFVCGCIFTVALLVRCGMPGAGIGAKGSTGATGNTGANNMMTPASATGLSVQTYTANCDHTVTSGSYVGYYAVFSISGFNPNAPTSMTAMACGYRAGSGVVFPAEYTQSPAGWVPATTDCQANVPTVSGSQVYLYCGASTDGAYQHATLWVTSTG